MSSSLVAVFIGGGMGSLFRYFISVIIPYQGSGFPKATFLANLMACIILGWAVVYFDQADPRIKLFLLTGVCGGFSTFSTFSAEVIKLVENNELGIALIYVLLSNLLGALCFYASYKLL